MEIFLYKLVIIFIMCRGTWSKFTWNKILVLLSYGVNTYLATLYPSMKARSQRRRQKAEVSREILGRVFVIVRFLALMNIGLMKIIVT